VNVVVQANCAIHRTDYQRALVVSCWHHLLHTFEIIAEKDRIDFLTSACRDSRFHQMFLVILELILKFVGHIPIVRQHEDSIVMYQVVESRPGVEFVDASPQIHAVGCGLAVHVKSQKRSGHIVIGKNEPLRFKVTGQACHFLAELNGAATNFREGVHVAGKRNQEGQIEKNRTAGGQCNCCDRQPSLPDVQ
jgi:hypothetical protein